MGVCVHNTKYEMDMGCGSFYRLRTRVALLLDKDFGENYEQLGSCCTPSQFKANDEIATRLLEKKQLDIDVVDFLYQRDCGGKISGKTCKKIYELVKDYDDDCMYGYAWANNTFAYFKEMLKYSARYNANLIWS